MNRVCQINAESAISVPYVKKNRSISDSVRRLTASQAWSDSEF